MTVFNIRATVPTSNPRAHNDAEINTTISLAYREFNAIHPLTTGPVTIARGSSSVAVSFQANFAGAVTQTVANQFQTMVADALKSLFPAPRTVSHGSSSAGSGGSGSTSGGTGSTTLPTTTVGNAASAAASGVSMPVLAAIGLLTAGGVYWALTRRG